tara:strand:- start:795 stop:1013 length:219 start_codon:yes stop_codon:yes gene_type:complete
MFTKYNATITYAPFGLQGMTMNGVIGRTRKDALALAIQTMKEVGVSQGMQSWEADANAKMAKIKLSKVKVTH